MSADTTPSQNSQQSAHDFRSHPQAEHLASWFAQNGGWLSPDVHIDYSDAKGFHLRALRPTTPLVASCPLKLTLSCLNLDPDQTDVLPIASPLQQCRGKIPDHILTYLLLIHERNKGKDSPWHAYITCLPGPDSMTTPMWFNDDDMAFLTGTSLVPAAKERKADLLKQWEHAVGVMKQVGVPFADDLSFESLLWAATIFTSRAFISTHILPDRETIPILFPVVDILNHSVSAKVEWDFKAHESFSLRCLESDSLTPGQELFNNYAPKQNDELLLGYGFCLEHNPIEQFALKLAFPPMLQEYAHEMGLLNPESVPFGMPSTFLATDPNKEQHFLRAQGHPFGRYENNVPFFRGIPPYIVHFFYIQSMLALEKDPATITAAHPGGRVTLQVLVLLHAALSQRCSTLPLSIPAEPTNYKQTYAKFYRDSQARIIHAVRNELAHTLTSLRTTDTITAPLNRASLVSLPTMLSLVQTTYPDAAARYTHALAQHALAGPSGERTLWAILLLISASQTLVSPAPPTSPLLALLTSLFASHALPALEDGIEDADTYSFLDEHLGDFLRLPAADPALSPTDVLDDLGLTFLNQPEGGADEAKVFVGGRTENLGVRLVMWAMRVVGDQTLVVPVGDEGAQGVVLYVVPVGEEGTDAEEWVKGEGNE